MSVRYVLLFLTAICVAVPVWAQTTFSGTVNTATAVTAISTTGCQTTIGVDDAAGFTMGDRILIIQMQDAASGGPCGLFELATVASVAGNVLTVRERLAHTYDLSGAVQVVRVATAANAIVTGTISPLPFNGRIGGVVVFEVAGTLELRADITATGAGFRGGVAVQGSATCGVMTPVGPNGSADLARRGEGIVFCPPVTGSGRSSNMNGGGGGAAHNSGGGGGAGAGPGGVGGRQWVGCGTTVDNGGLGGAALTIDPANTRLYLGGGGGAGQMNNNEGTSGGAGGGIIIIRAQRLIGNGNIIEANGQDVLQDAGRDGAGGGGGGGMILLDVQQISNGVALQSHGGAGGHTTTNAQHGTGGGGGGGAILTSLASVPNDVSTYVWGGTHGENLSFPSDPNRSWGSQDGGDGLMRYSAVFAFGTTIEPPDVTAADDVVICDDTTVVLDAAVTKGLAPYRWQWFNDRGAEVGTTRTISVMSRPPQRFIVRITDAGGCIDEDTLWVLRGPAPLLTVDTLNLGVLSRCVLPVDTSITIRNLTSRAATITSITSPSSVLQILAPPLPIILGADTSMSVPIRIHGGATGTATIEIAASDTCDTTLITIVQWSIDTSDGDIAPTRIDLPRLALCDTSNLTPLTFTYSGSDATLDTVLIQGTIPLTFATPAQLTDGMNITPQRTWPGYGVHTGRIGFVISFSGCVDTIWADVTDTLVKNVLEIADINMGIGLPCRYTLSILSAPVTIIGDTTQVMTITDITVPPELRTTWSRGMQFRHGDVIDVVLVPTTAGPFEYTITIAVTPCDTVINILVRGVVVEQRLDVTPELAFTQQLIGGTETLRAVLTNTGSTEIRLRSITQALAPFTITSTQSPLPSVIPAGGTFWFDVTLTATPGTFMDTVVVEIDSPCVEQRTVVLTSTVSAITRLYMPRVQVGSDWHADMPIIFEEVPNVSSTPPPSFEVNILVDAKHAAYADSAMIVGTDLRISIRDVWRGGDTLAKPRLLSLLTATDSVDVRFDPAQPFRWISTPSVVEYRNGLLILPNVCASRPLRTILVGGAMASVHVSPLPADDVINVDVQTTQTEDITIQLADVHGRALLTTSGKSDSPIALSIIELASGWYQLTISTRFETRSMPVIIAR